MAQGWAAFVAPLRLCAFAAALAAACTDAGVRPTASTQVADSADQRLLKMTTTITSEGIRRSYVEAETAYVYQSQAITDLRRMRILFFDEQGNLKSTLVADKGLLGTYSNRLEARGNVIVTSPDGRRLTTQHLIYDKQANKITIDTAFSSEGPTGRLSGNCMESDPGFNNVSVCQPRGVQKGQGFLLPGQKRDSL
jgi:LPS export ABC transporter protein LptC